MLRTKRNFPTVQRKKINASLNNTEALQLLFMQIYVQDPFVVTSYTNLKTNGILM